LYPVNPARKEVQGVRCYPELSALPEVPDVAIIAVPGDSAVQAIDACAEAGVALAVVMTSGFGESDPDGERKQREMVARSRARGMRIVGPNSQGLANFGSGAVLSFSTMFTEVPPKQGPVGIISQSGAMSVIPYGLLSQRGIGVRHSHATGNDCDVTVCELATVVAEDPELKLLLLYLEGIPDPWHLAEAAAVARERGLPIVALKGGRSPAGQEAAQSHTGALASEDIVVDAFLAEHGIWRAQDMTELVNSAELYLQGWKPRGRRLVAISNSGAVCVLTADAATAAHMPLEPLSAETQAQLRGILPGFATTTNPVDITAALLTNSRLFSDILPPIAKDPAADAFLVGIAVAGAGYDVPAFASDTAKFAEATGKPVVVAAPQPSVGEAFKSHGLPVFATEVEAVRALAQFLSHAELMAQVRARAPAIPSPRRPPGPVTMMDEAASLALLEQAGIAVARHGVCSDAAEAVAAWMSLGRGAVVVKGCTADASHKTELGLVRVGPDSEAAVAQACESVIAAAAAAKVQLSGVIVAQLVRGRRELMIGARVDPVFGPVVLVGDGGKYVEAMPDAQVLLPPFDTRQVEQALRLLRIAPLLDGVRGEPPLDVASFSACAVAVGRLMLDASQGIAQLDINPVIVRARGEGCAAVDAVIYRETQTGTRGTQ
jgi:acetate---CoA ligase (ADP-forming)